MLNNPRLPLSWRSTVALLALLTLSAMSHAASFDCGKARRPIEKFICSQPELDAADTRLGEVFKQVHAGFPSKGFLLATQRVFVADYPSCLTDDQGKTSSGPASVRRCVNLVKERIQALESQALALVYSDAPAKFAHDGLTILLYNSQGQQRIRLWGNWMPDAYKPEPFPAGKLCDLDAALKPVKGGFKTDDTDDAVFVITESQLSISEYIMCTPRNGIAPGPYRRLR
jgi:uncharacterized protein YecT (DUF1311 family)